MILPPTIPDSCARLLAWCDRRPHQARRIAQKLLTYTAPASADYAWAQLTFGWCLMICEQTTETIAVLQQAREALQSMGETWGALHAEHGMLRAKLLQGLQADDVEVWDALATRCLAAGFPLEAAQVRIEQMRALNMLWRAVDALALCNEVTGLLQHTDAPHVQASLWRAMGTAHLILGNFSDAAHALTQAEHTFAQLRLPIDRARTWFEQARLALVQDQLSEAYDQHWRAYHAFTQLQFPLRAAFCKKNLGTITAQLGQLDHAIAHLLQARTLFDTLHQSHYSADCTLNLGIVAFYSGLYELALGAWQQAEAQYITLDMRGMILVSRRNQALAHYHMQQLDAAQVLVADLLRQAEHLAAQSELAELYQLMGEICAAQGQQSQATIWLERAEQSFLRLPNRPAAARVWLAQGMIALQEGHVSDAEEAFQRAQPELEQRGSYYWRVLHGRGRCAEIQGDRAAALSLYTRASAILSQLRHTLADAYASSALFSTARQLSDDALRLAVQQQQPETVIQLTEQQRAIALQQYIQHEPLIFPPGLQDQYEQQRTALRTLLAQHGHGPMLDRAIAVYLETLLYGRHYMMPDEHASKPTGDMIITDIRELLCRFYGNDWTALIYSSGEEHLVIVNMTAEALGLHTIPMDRPFQRSLQRITLARYRPYIYHDMPFQSGQCQEPWADFATMGTQLVPETVMARLHPGHRLLIVSCDMLRTLPWAALRVHGHWLVEKAIIQLLPSLTIWTNLVKRQASGNQALLIGISDYGERAPALPNALVSLESVQQYWPGPCTRLENAQVSRTALLAAARSGALQQYRLLHFSLHGQQLTGRGMLAHLKLADDDLLVDEVAQLCLRGALVVLAACEGASEEYLPGEEVLSLNRAFLAAGAQDVIASLWPLYDTTILPMLALFYEALTQEQDPPAALAVAQRRCLQWDGNDDRALPFTWGSLCTMGAGTTSLSLAVVPGRQQEQSGFNA